MPVTDRKQRDKKRKALLKSLKLQVDLACEPGPSESHRRENLERAFVLLVRLLRIDQNKKARQELLRIFAVSNPDSDITLELDGRALFVNGTIDCKELAKYVVWGHGVHVINGE